jgi:DNA topoisomerase-1
MIQFAEALPYIRKHLKHDISLRGLPRLKILATVVSLLEATLIRVGNSEYARDNRSFGLTTMRSRHVQVDSESVTFTFQGKSRVHHVVNLHDRRLAGIIKRCADLPGYELFQYVDHDGQRHRISSSDVNGYLHDMTGQHFTAKDFRTWAGSVLACDLLRGLQPCESENQAKKNIVQAIKEVAARLGNTLAVCRKCYVHPLVLETYLAGETLPLVRRSRPGLHHEELVLLKLLKLRSGDSLR